MKNISLICLFIVLIKGFSISQTSTNYSQLNGNSSQTGSNSDLPLNTITTAMPFLSINPDSRSGA